MTNGAQPRPGGGNVERMCQRFKRDARRIDSTNSDRQHSLQSILPAPLRFAYGWLHLSAEIVCGKFQQTGIAPMSEAQR